VTRRGARGLAGLLAAGMLLASGTGRAAGGLEAALNSLRGRPAACPEGQTAAAPPLIDSPRLTQAAELLAGQRPPGGDLNAALGAVRYQPRLSMLLQITGVADTDELARYADQRFCRVLRGRDWSEIGIFQQPAGNQLRTFIVLARPLDLPAPGAGATAAAGRQVLELVNQVRASARVCGSRRFGPAPALAWNEHLAQAAQHQAAEMAQYQYFSHTGRDGGDVGQRARRAGYAWKSVGENLATGQTTPEEVTAGWVASPGHCANLMNPGFTEMGAAYALNSASRTAIYWAQVFGMPR